MSSPINRLNPLNGESEHTRRMSVDALRGLQRIERGSVQDMPLTQRAKNVLAMNGVDTILKLTNLDAKEMQGWRQCGPETMREILRACLDKFIKPNWAGLIAYHIGFDAVMINAPEGYSCLTTVYQRTENWMVEIALADMRRFQTPACLVGNGLGVEIWRKGGMFPEEGEE